MTCYNCGMAKNVSRHFTEAERSKSDATGRWVDRDATSGAIKREASRQVRTTARSVISQYRKALEDLAKY